MNVTAANLDALFKTFQTKFSEAQKTAQSRAFPNDLLPEDIAIAFAASGAATQHSWLEQIKGIHEWVGERVLNNAKLGKLTVVNRDFENTIKVSRNEIEDDQYGVYAPLIGMMGSDAENLWKKLAIEALTGNGEWADGNPFFCSGRTLGQSTITSACPVSASRSTRDVSSSSSADVTNSGFTCSSSSIQRRSSCVGATTLIQHPRTGASTLPVNGTFVPSAATSCDVL